jgi:chromosome segregation ATPase
MLSEGFEEIGRQAERNGEEIQKILEVLAKQAVKPINEAAAQLTETTSQLSEIIGKFGTAVETVGKKLEDIRAPEDVVRAELAPAIAAIKDLAEAQLQPLRNIERTLSRIADLPGRPLSPELKLVDQQPEKISGAEAVSAHKEALSGTVGRKRRWHLW